MGSNVAEINLNIERVTGVLPAPSHCIDIAMAPDGRLLYDAVGTVQYGNIQAYPLAG